MLIELAVGAAAALVTVLVLRRRGSSPDSYATVLVLMALIYLGFALLSASPGWILFEALGLALYGMVAFLGRKLSVWLLAAGLAGHVLWDLLPHPTSVPAWYPNVCIAYDLLIAGYAGWQIARRVA